MVAICHLDQSAGDLGVVDVEVGEMGLRGRRCATDARRGRAQHKIKDPKISPGRRRFHGYLLCFATQSTAARGARSPAPSPGWLLRGLPLQDLGRIPAGIGVPIQGLMRWWAAGLVTLVARDRIPGEHKWAG